MSSLWTPGGERRVPRPGEGPDSGENPPQGPGGAAAGPEAHPGEPPEEQVAELRRQLAETPAESVVANHCYGLFELAALHMSVDPPRLEQARVAIDALACVVEGMSGRLGPDEATLAEGLAQIRLAFVRLSRGGDAGDGAHGG